jgi:threonine synthase
MKLKYKPGNTPLIKIEKLCKKFGLPNLFIKDESKNPFGTFKDRRSEYIIQRGGRASYRQICNNYIWKCGL